ncbi:MAG: hypothetical protein IJS94_01135 [Clostridia bacterium]|nr:hypothetical protein [Clostridia bacterium]
MFSKYVIFVTDRKSLPIMIDEMHVYANDGITVRSGDRVTRDYILSFRIRSGYSDRVLDKLFELRANGLMVKGLTVD